MPLHRLPAHPRRRAAHVRPARGAAGHRAGDRRRCASLAAPRHASTTRTGAALPCAEDAGRAGRAARSASPTAQLLAGSTDVGLWVNKQFRELGEIVYLGDVAELQAHRAAERRRRLVDRRRRLARSRLARAGAALARRSPTCGCASPRRRSAMPARWAATSPTARRSAIRAPVLMALDAQIELRQGARVRRMPLPEFYVDYMKNRLEAGRVRAGAARAAAGRGAQVRAYKISKRFDCDISALCAGLAIELDGDTVREVRLAFGGMAATVKRAAAAEAALLGQPWTQASVDAAQGRAGAGLQAAERHARQRRLPRCRWRRTCCSASGSKRAPRPAAGPAPRQRDRRAWPRARPE